MSEEVTVQDRATLLWLPRNYAKEITRAKAAEIRADIAAALEEWRKDKLRTMSRDDRRKFASAEAWKLVGHPLVTTNMDAVLYLYDETRPSRWGEAEFPIHRVFDKHRYRYAGAVLIIDAKNGPLPPLIRAVTWLTWHVYNEAARKLQIHAEAAEDATSAFSAYLEAEQEAKRRSKTKGDRAIAAVRNRATKALNDQRRLMWYRETVEVHRSIAPNSRRQATLDYVAPLAKARFGHTRSVASKYISRLHIFGSPKKRGIAGPYEIQAD